MLTPIIVLGCLGFTAAVALGIAARIFFVQEDPRIELVANTLPGANCGGCGLAGCAAAAEAIVKGEAPPDVCVVGGFEVAQQVAAIFGIVVEEKEPEIAKPGCTYGITEADLKYYYSGVMDCRAAALLFGGSKECNIGCLGLGSCVNVCKFSALSMGEQNLPVVNSDLCTGCGSCVEVCPKGIITLSSASIRMMADNKVTECTAPCQRHCPAEIDIPTYIKHISKGDYAEAVRTIKEKNPFPLICGWICPAPCEYECRRNLIDEPVNINALKKFVSDYERKSGRQIHPHYNQKIIGKTIAVIGGGVEGLTSAYYLRRLGHKPKVFEATAKLGGILRYVITEDRLPRDVLDWEINNILEWGIEAETNRVLGQDFNLASLLNNDSDIDIVLLTTGGWDSRQIMRSQTIPQCAVPQTFLLLDYLIATKKNKTIIPGENVVIADGGRAAIEAAKICLKNNAKKVTVLFPFCQDHAAENNLTGDGIEGLEVRYSAVPIELKGDGNQLTEITILGEKDHVETLPLDCLIVGTGSFAEMAFTRVEGTQWKTIEVIKSLHEESGRGLFSINQTSRVSDLTGVVFSVRRGRKLARSIHLNLLGEEIAPEKGVIINENELQNIHKILHADSYQAVRIKKDPIYTLNDEEAKSEAARCLECGLICYKKPPLMETLQ